MQHSGQGSAERAPAPEVSGWLVLAAVPWRPSWHRHPFNTRIHILVCNLFSPRSISTLRWKQRPFLFSRGPEGWSGLRLWASLSNGDRCCLLSPGPHGAGITRGEGSAWGTQPLVFIEQLCYNGLNHVSWQYVVCFWHFNLWRISFWNTLLWGPHGISAEMLLRGTRANLRCCQNLESSLCLCDLSVPTLGTLYNQVCQRR